MAAVEIANNRSWITRKRTRSNATTCGFECDQCDQWFARRFSLRDHKRAQHTKERPHACDQCDKRFVRKHDLTSHVNRIHGTARFTCKKCGAQTRHPFSFKRHTATCRANETLRVVDPDQQQTSQHQSSEIIPLVATQEPQSSPLQFAFGDSSDPAWYDAMQGIEAAEASSRLLQQTIQSSQKPETVRNVANPDEYMSLQLVNDTPRLANFLNRRSYSIAWANKALLEATQNSVEGSVQLLVSCVQGIDLYIKDVGGNTPLHLAAERGFREIARILLDSGAKVDVLDTAGRPPLSIALHHGHSECARLLLDAGADVNIRDRSGSGPLHWAGHRHRHQTVETILLESIIRETKDLNCMTWFGATPLYFAASFGDVNLLRLLIEHGADMDLTGRNKSSPLNIAMATGNMNCANILLDNQIARHVRMLEKPEAIMSRMKSWASKHIEDAENYPIPPSDYQALVMLVNIGKTGYSEVNSKKLLRPKDITQFLLASASFGLVACVETAINSGADKNATDPDGKSALHLAVLADSFDCVSRILSAGANKDHQTSDGRTALHIAAQEGNLMILETLLSAGADVTLRTGFGHSVAHVAVMCGHVSILAPLFAASIGLDFVNDVNAEGENALHIAAKDMSCCSLQFLLNHGFDVNSKDHSGSTALHSAVVFQNYMAVDLLLKAGADPNEKDDEGDTPLHEAATRDDPSCLELLLEAGANPTEKGKSGFSPLLFAISYCRLECLDVLLQAGVSMRAQDGYGNTALHVLAEFCHVTVDGEVRACEKQIRRVAKVLLENVPEDVDVLNEKQNSVLVEWIFRDVILEDTLSLLLDKVSAINQVVTALSVTALDVTNAEMRRLAALNLTVGTLSDTRKQWVKRMQRMTAIHGMLRDRGAKTMYELKKIDSSNEDDDLETTDTSSDDDNSEAHDE